VPYLKRYNFQAKTIVDVGVHAGTEPLYGAFPDRQFVLVEPLPGSEELTRKRFPSLNIDFFACAAGAATGESEFLIRPDIKWFSGLIPRADNRGGIEAVRVKVERLDRILSDHKYARPFGVKIDVEGFELQVLHGLGELASDVEFFIVESSIKHEYEKEDRFSDLVIKMKEMGFELADILNVLGHPPAVHDCLFLPRDDARFEA
jgi:FkbM family methyltransferase